MKWIFSAFALIKEDPDKWKQDRYPYRIIHTPTGYFYYDPDLNDIAPVEGAVAGNPLYNAKEKIVLYPGDLENVQEQIVSTLGNLLFNKLCLADCFGSKIKYINERVNPAALMDEIATRLVDDPAPTQDMNGKLFVLPGTSNTDIYCCEYVKFNDAVFAMTQLTQLFTWALTEKAILPPDGVEEFKASLFEKYADKLNDPATLAIIDKELIAYDAQYLKGDPAENFLISAKSRNIVRKKKYLAYGAERSLMGGNKLTYIPKSLNLGWDVSKFPEMNDASRAGSFGRGSETQLGGVSFKEILRATANLAVTIDDCGTTVGRPILVNKQNIKRQVGRYHIKSDGSIEFLKTPEDSAQYLGKVIRRRSPMYCKLLDSNEICKTCIGFNLASNPTAVSMAIADYGSAFLGIKMGAMHGKEIKTKEIDFELLLT
jgi:hypothetical protein